MTREKVYALRVREWGKITIDKIDAEVYDSVVPVINAMVDLKEVASFDDAASIISDRAHRGRGNVVWSPRHVDVPEGVTLHVDDRLEQTVIGYMGVGCWDGAVVRHNESYALHPDYDLLAVRIKT